MQYFEMCDLQVHSLDILEATLMYCQSLTPAAFETLIVAASLS